MRSRVVKLCFRRCLLATISDWIIPKNNSIQCHSDVRKQDPRIEDFYHFFLAPGFCIVEEVLEPTQSDALDLLVFWVEKGVPPTKLSGVS